MKKTHNDRFVFTIATVDPLNSHFQENYDLRLTNENGVLELKYRPSQQRRWFLTPITVSRYEGIRQCGASVTWRGEGRSNAWKGPVVGGAVPAGSGLIIVTAVVGAISQLMGIYHRLIPINKNTTAPPKQ